MFLGYLSDRQDDREYAPADGPIFMPLSDNHESPLRLFPRKFYPFGERCRRWGVVPSMGSVEDCFDSAMAESFFATLECELLDRTHFHDPRSSRGQAHPQARRAIFEFIEGRYHPHRRHQGLGQHSPMAFERSDQEAA